jgi:hypothetical protein
MSPRETAEYVATLLCELARHAREADLTTLAHLLEMARLQAETDAKR